MILPPSLLVPHKSSDGALYSGVLLSTLCDKSNAIGEIGYFLASFEAVIAHLQQLNPAQETEEVSSTALSDVALNE